MLGRSWNLATFRKRKTLPLILTAVDGGLCWGGDVWFPVFKHTLKRLFEKRENMVQSCQMLSH